MKTEVFLLQMSLNEMKSDGLELVKLKTTAVEEKDLGKSSGTQVQMMQYRGQQKIAGMINKHTVFPLEDNVLVKHVFLVIMI